jgi:hypothetical protein
VPTARFFFDYGSGTALWTVEPQGPDGEYFVDLDQLPISRTLREVLQDLLVEYDSSLNWGSPADPGPWREPRCRRFNEDARQALHRLREELEPAWQIVDAFSELHEDPDLDRYLAGPAGFNRGGGSARATSRLSKAVRALARRDKPGKL